MATARTFKQILGAIWGGGATTYAGTQPSPAQGTAYRNTTADATTDYTSGLKFLSKSPSEVMNQALFNLSSALDQLQTHGTLGWEPATDYPVGAMCFDSANAPRMAVKANGPSTIVVDPFVDSSGATWAYMPPVGRTSFAATDSMVMFGLTIKWGVVSNLTAQGSSSVIFAAQFPVSCLNVQLTASNPNAVGNAFGDYWPQIVSMSNTGFTFYNQAATENTGGGQVFWFAIGY